MLLYKKLLLMTFGTTLVLQSHSWSKMTQHTYFLYFRGFSSVLPCWCHYNNLGPNVFFPHPFQLTIRYHPTIRAALSLVSTEAVRNQEVLRHNYSAGSVPYASYCVTYQKMEASVFLDDNLDFCCPHVARCRPWTLWRIQASRTYS